MSLAVIFGSLLSLLGGGILFLGIMFLAASDGITSRLITAIVMLVFGTILLVTGIILFRRGIRFSPEGIRKRILQLAHKYHGVVTEENVVGGVGSSPEIEAVLQNLILEGITEERANAERKVYLFADFGMKLIVKSCPYCGNDYPLRDDVKQCYSCGGDLKEEIKRTGDDSLFSMDVNE